MYTGLPPAASPPKTKEWNFAKITLNFIQASLILIYKGSVRSESRSICYIES